jgi:hypothetical protein
VISTPPPFTSPSRAASKTKPSPYSSPFKRERVGVRDNWSPVRRRARVGGIITGLPVRGGGIFWKGSQPLDNQKIVLYNPLII